MSRSRENASGLDRAAFIERLQMILRHWPSADRLARATGVSPSAFRKWLRGEAEPSRERLVALARAAGVSSGWLVSGEGPEPRLLQVAAPKRDLDDIAGEPALDGRLFVLLPKRPEAAAAGRETPIPPRGSEYLALRHDWVRSNLGIDPDKLLVETAIGESMQPSIRNGDMLLIDSTIGQFHSFGVYVLEVAGERLVKRVQRKLDGSVILISDNAAYEPERIPPEQAQDVRVVGRVLWTCGPTRSSH